MTAPRFAAIDCGTNSIRLLIAEYAGDASAPRELHRDNIIVRLGEGVDATAQFSPAALERVDQALAVYVEKMLEYNVQDVMMGATSATRDARNREDFFALTRKHLGRIREGACAEVISGEQEARLSFVGAVADLPAGDYSDTCVIDLGGGSTEFVVGGKEAYSADMGCVRLTERFLDTQPPSEEDIAQARAYVDGLMGTVEQNVDLSRVKKVIGVAGTMTTMTAVVLGLGTYDAEKTHLATIPLEEFRTTARDILHKTPQQRLELGPMHPGRADVIGGGAIVVDAFTTRFLELGLEEITISEKDILDGILAEVISRWGAS